MPQRKGLEPLPGTQTLRPPSRQGPQPSFWASPPPPFRLLFWKEQSHLSGPAPVPVLLLSHCQPLPREDTSSHPAAPSQTLSSGQRMKGRLPEGQWFSSLGTLWSAPRLREAPWWPRSCGPGEAEQPLSRALPAFAAPVHPPPIPKWFCVTRTVRGDEGGG